MGNLNSKEKDKKRVTKKIPKENEFDGGEIDLKLVSKILSNIVQNTKKSQERDRSELACRGISLDYLFEWWEKAKNDETSPILISTDSTTRQVVDYIRHKTKDSKSPLWATVDPIHQGIPTFAISHSWDYQFEFLIETLKFNRLHGPTELGKVRFVWLDIFA